jgi:hypothetical protein
VTRPAQLDLFTHVEQTIIRIADEVAAGVPQRFDFLADGDAASCEPDPTWTPPEWLRLGIDDPEWQPKGMMG